MLVICIRFAFIVQLLFPQSKLKMVISMSVIGKLKQCYISVALLFPNSCLSRRRGIGNQSSCIQGSC
ncbi:unnamed protein product [Coffea canephora]|uniref:Uncharacterized protein n=1 Tax=Coffea canephora TaxID=49390 RepID=A0A068URX8_COFCA|nr:unnamed protein product [Coffea canephora]